MNENTLARHTADEPAHDPVLTTSEMLATIAEYKATLREIYVNVREIRSAVYGKDPKTISVIFAGMADEILEVTSKVLEDGGK